MQRRLRLTGARTRALRPRKLGVLTVAALLGTSCAHAATTTQGTIYFGGRELSLRYEGSCAHLACCSSYAVPVPAQTLGAFRCDTRANGCAASAGWFAPGFTCNPLEQGRYRQPEDPPYLACNDSERWLSLPNLSHSACGERYLVCYRGVRVTAIVRDKSARNDSGRVHYEGSLGLLNAIGADPEARETLVSIYALSETDRIAADPHCVGSGR